MTSSKTACLKIQFKYIKKFLQVPDRKLRLFAQCPLRNLERWSGGNKDTRDKYLMIWLYEQVSDDLNDVSSNNGTIRFVEF